VPSCAIVSVFEGIAESILENVLGGVLGSAIAVYLGASRNLT